jgi:hypothetical protein
VSTNFFNIRNGCNLGAQASDPSGGRAGDFYYNSTSNKIRWHNGTVWADVGSGGGGNMTVDTFSGTGAQVNFTLSVDPGSENNTEVFIEGVYQQKSTYTVVGTTLTFSVAPPTGTNTIEVVSGTTASMILPNTTKGDLAGFSTTAARVPVGSNGQVLTANSAAALGLQWSTPGGAASVFTSNGTFTTPANSSTTTIYKYIILGAGGGGGGSNGAAAVGGGGGAGALAIGTFTGVAESTAITINIGLGGTAGSTAGGNGGTGGSSSIGAPVSITCSGGVGGNGNTSATSTGSEGGAGGSVTGSPNILTLVGGRGGRGWSTAASTGVAGCGANALYGNGGWGGTLNVAQGPAVATGYGAGGGGGFLATTAGGAGRDGLVIIEQLTP